jgi:hypothetical protein
MVGMATPHAAPEISSKVLKDARWALIERIADSPHLKSSARLREFLFYISDCAIRDAPEEATEQQIGIRIFHRHPGYNSSEDSIVRTHARLLRQKLAVYFAEEGLHEKIVVDVPKGHYLPVFHPRGELPHSEPVEVALPPTPLIGQTPEGNDTAPRHRKWNLALVFVFLPVLAAGLFLALRPRAGHAAPQTAIDKFWQPFFSNSDPPLVIFSNALFAGDSKSGLRYAPQEPGENAQPGQNFVDTYTGIGELASVYMLTRLFDAHQADFILKRSLLMTWDEAQAKNLIFIGSAAENPSLRVLPSTRDFTMVAEPDSAGVVNHNPKPGEPAIYSRPEHPLKVDYAILALLPGVEPSKHTLIFSGLTTFGTQAAVQYVCNPDTMADLLRHITGPKGEIHPFEAVLETTIGGGVPLETRLVTIRVH